MRTTLRFVVLTLCLPAFALADGPQDNIPDNVRRVPKLGIEVPDEDRAKLTEGIGKLDAMVDQLRKRKDARTVELLPDVEVYRKAVHDALHYQEFFKPQEIKAAYELLDVGMARAEALAKGEAPWTTQTGLVVRGYVSKIDGSVQPYGLVIPESYHPGVRHRLDVWFHGRGETLSELAFIDQRRKQAGQYTPRDTIVLHPYGRYSNAFKFAGETDVLEAIDDVQRRYSVADDRIAVRGFSMGGAACWQFAVHYPSRWFAANPGAGFSETPEFLRTFQGQTLDPTWWERKLWHLYDCTDYAANLYHLPTVAYSGELDIQKQAADIMEKALAKEGMTLTHVIGPQTKHKIHPDSAKIIEAKLDSIAQADRDRTPDTVRLTTYTLKYNRVHWVTIDEVFEHWEPAKIEASRSFDLTEVAGLLVTARNVTAFTLDFPAGTFSALTPLVRIKIDGDVVMCPGAQTDRSWSASFHLDDGSWKLGRRPMMPGELRKRHDLQGPVDDAFMDSFYFVRPTGKAANEAVGRWSDAELNRAVEHWRRHFRGTARVIDDVDVTDEHIAGGNLVLWGDPSSNAVLKRIADKLPIKWDDRSITAGDRTWPAAHHALIAIYPNPLNPSRYVVLNSSFTYREFAYLNNARQVPMLPDWAVIDLRTPPGTVWPGKVVDADFFSETWQLKPPHDR